MQFIEVVKVLNLFAERPPEVEYMERFVLGTECSVFLARRGRRQRTFPVSIDGEQVTVIERLSPVRKKNPYVTSLVKPMHPGIRFIAGDWMIVQQITRAPAIALRCPSYEEVEGLREWVANQNNPAIWYIAPVLPYDDPHGRSHVSISRDPISFVIAFTESHAVVTGHACSAGVVSSSGFRR